MIRTAVLSFRPHYSNSLLRTGRKLSQSSRIFIPMRQVKQLFFINRSFQLMSKNCYPIFHLRNFRHYSATLPNIIQSLNDFIISENYEDEQIEELNKIVYFLLSKGCTMKDIKEKCLPHLKLSDCSYLKFKQLGDIGSDIMLLFPLLSLPLTTLRSAAKQARNDKPIIKDFPDRVTYLSHYFELKLTELIPALIKHSALLTMNFNRLDYKMKILKNANISTKYIVKDLWIFNYNERLLGNRIQAAVEAEMELKPWMLRCSEKFFVSMLMKNCETQRILGGENVVHYLAKKLSCSIEYVEYMMERNKLLKAINIPKLEQILNFLFEKGYTAQEIRLFPRVFCSSLQTLNRRFIEFQQLKSTLPTISQLCISSRKFETSLKNKS